MWTSVHLPNNHDSTMKKRISFVTRMQNPGLIEAGAAAQQHGSRERGAPPVVLAREELGSLVSERGIHHGKHPDRVGPPAP